MNRRFEIQSSRARLAAFLAALAAAACLSVLSTAPSFAAGSRVSIETVSPDFVAPGDRLFPVTSIENFGPEPLQGNLTLKYTFPDGIEPAEPSEITGHLQGFGCSTVGQVVECTGDATGTFPGAEIRFFNMGVMVEDTASGVLTGSIELSGPAIGQTVSEPLIFTVGSTPFGIKSLEVLPEGVGAWPVGQAGASLDELATRISVLSQARVLGGLSPLTAPAESFRDVVTHVPPGMVGNPLATGARCTSPQLARILSGLQGISSCPLSSQIGTVKIYYGGDLTPLWNMVPPPGYPAAFGFIYSGVVTTLLPRIRPGDNGIDLVAERATNSVPLPRLKVTLWGIPADPSHDSLRGPCMAAYAGYNGTDLSACTLLGGERLPFLRNPTSCTGAPLPWSIEMDTYQNPGVFHHKDGVSPAIEGCEKVPFDPNLSLASSERSARSTSGLDVELKMPQDQGPDGLSQADLRAATVELPAGFTVNPASADGLQACSDEQLRLGQYGPSNCPDAAKIGSIELKSPLLEDSIAGSVYLRSQASKDPQSGDLFRLALELDSDRFGVHIKLPGSLVVNEKTGQLTTRFKDLPQLPFESMQLHLNNGPRAPLTVPSTCGTYKAHAELEGWNGKTASFDPSFTIDQNCSSSAFKPGFEAGVKNDGAGDFSPFVLRVTRDANQPNLSRIDATLPEGELAKLAGVPICSGAKATAGDCPAASRIGSVVAGIGEGSIPLFLPQPEKSPTSVYLAAPYKGAPYSVVAEVPAQAGPFDLGQVVVRSALRIDPESVQATVASDPLPQIFSGIPVAYRDVRIRIDRPKFTINPTDCTPTAVTGVLGSTAGDNARVSDRFQVGECAALGFKPKLTLRLKGQTRRAGHPALKAVLKMPSGGANIARTSVALPHSEFLAQSHINTSCTRVQYAAGKGGGAECPKGAVYGKARAFSPLLDGALEGPVYLRSNGGARELPDLVASLDGPIHVDLVGYIDVDKKTEGLRTTFARVPDAPVSKFVLKLPAGKKGLLENSTNICRGKHRAVVKMTGQNGKIHDFRPLVKAKCGKGARKR